MSNEERKYQKHKKIVRQRIFTAVMTIFILALLSVGLYYGARVVLAEYRKNQAISQSSAPKTAEDKVETESEDSALTDDWYIAADDEIEDDYADIPDISANTVSDSAISGASPEIEEKISAMSLEAKIASLFIITPEALTGVDVATAAGEATKQSLSANPVSGLVYFAQNINEPEQTKKMLKNTQDYAKELFGLPIFLGVDEEGGKVSRITSNEAFSTVSSPSMWELGLSENDDDSYLAGENTGKLLKEYGFNLDFAPVCDIVSSSENSAIGSRSFGSDPERVSSLSWLFASGLSDSGIVPCFKHYPGLGDTEEDTHLQTVSLKKSLSDLQKKELIPFENAALSGAEMIMAGHVSCPLVTGDDTPASLSEVMLSDILRNNLGYNGVIITDSFSMSAVKDNYTPEEAAKLAIKAGADIILMPSDFEASKNALISAVENGEISEERIDESLRRILSLRSKLSGP